MSGLNPQGCQVFSFKQPSSQEYDHDFLWRHYHALPEKGRIGIHNRSHYENVLICKVHPQLVLKEGLRNYTTVESLDKAFWDNRYQSIVDFEKHLHLNGTVIIKFYLNLSKKEQKERFLERIDDPLKNWKFSSFDVEERAHWDEYMEAYEEAISNTATEDAPWFVVPADKKWFTRIAISKIIVDTLKSLDLQMPELSEEEKAKLDESRKQLQSE
jgi:PPK2 family polyphosphate:nucleotide phosphotransferase